jgi:hypothetical protein
MMTMMMTSDCEEIPKVKRAKRREQATPWVQMPMGDKDYDSVWRFVVGNIGTVPSPNTASGLWKIDEWRHLAKNCDVNILTEINKDMAKVQERDKIESITKGWWNGGMVRTAYLIEQDYALRDKRQQGGVALLANGMITTHIIEQGGDTRHLGRWRWMVCRGKQEHKTCIIGCYKPGSTWVAALNQTVALQKKRKHGDPATDPLVLWIDDITELITSKQEEGCEIILAGDFNEDLLDVNSQINQMAQRLGLREALLEKYDIPRGFSTYARGSTVIDGVFVSDGLSITKGGYTSNDESPSDHRWIWFDITVNRMVGETLHERARPLERKATAKIPSIKEKFNFLLNEQISWHQLKAKTQHLADAVSVQMKNSGYIEKDTQLQMDRLNDILVRVIKTADNQCQKGRRGTVPSSPILNQARGRIRILHLILRRWKEKGKQGRPHMNRIKRLAKKYKYKDNLVFSSMNEVQEARRIALNQYKELKPFAFDYRATYLGRIADELSKRDGKDIGQHFRHLMAQEELKQQYRRIKYAEGRPLRKGVDVIEQEDSNGTRVRVTDKIDIEEAIMAANKSKLLQAYNTPLRISPLQELLGEQMHFDKWEEILKGKITLPEEGIDEGTRLWYNYVSSQELSDFKLSWTTEEYFDSWTKMKEDKSSAPGIHIGHIKCIDPASDAAFVVSTLALLPLQSGYAPALWRVGIDSMIPKKTSDLRPEKLRLILLMDARFNHNNKLIGKKMLEYGEKNKKLADEQYGSRKNKSAIEHALNKRLILDHIRQFRKQAIYCANDARSCYDRILFIVAYLTLRIFGVPKEAARCSVDTICRMKHYIRTIFGDSQDYYGGKKWVSEDGQWPHGNGQGNGNGPSLWSCISSPLLNILREEGFGITWESPISKAPIKLSAIGFVDDMDYIQTQNPEDCTDMTALFAKAQAGMRLWDDLLRTTGGSLEIDVNKTDFVAVDFVQRNGLMKMSDAKSNRTLVAKDTNGEYRPLTQLTINDARKTLGVYQSPRGDEGAQFLYMMNKVLTWTSKIKKSNIGRMDTLKAVSATIGRTLEYPLPATALQDYHCQKIMSAFLQVALPKMGYVRTMARNIVFAPTDIMGGGVRDLFLIQLIQHIQILLDHGNQVTVTGRLLRVVVEGCYIETGFGGDLFNVNMAKVTWVSKTWLTDTIAAMQRYRIRLLHNIPNLKIWKERDVFLMEMFQDSKLFSNQELKWINEVRVFLQVMTISDITSSDGRYIKQKVYDGLRDFSCSGAAYHWPRAATPTRSSLKVWKAALRKIFNMQDNFGIDENFICNKWNKESLTYIAWRWDVHKRILYHREEDNSYSIWKNAPGPNRTRYQLSFYHRILSRAYHIPNSAIPVDIKTNEGNIAQLINKGQLYEREEEDGSNLTTERDWSNRYITLPPDGGESFAADVHSNEGKLVCDGSFKDGMASSAFITISDEEASGGNILPGSSLCQSAYRGELGGILGAVVFTKRVCTTFHITTGSVTVGCDCKGAIAAVKKVGRINSRWNSYDVLSRIQQELRSTRIKFAFKYIKGHQDSYKQDEELDDWEKANVKADTLAKEYLTDFGQSTSGFLPPITSSDMWVICQNSQPIVRDISKRIYYNVWGALGQHFWIKKLRINSASEDCIDWSILSTVSKLVPEYKRQRYIKVMADVAPVGKTLCIRGVDASLHCPLCGCEENNTHIWQCLDEHIKDILAQGMKEVQNWLAKGPWFFHNFFMEQVKDFGIDFEAINPEQELNEQQQTAVTNQTQLGIWATMWGIYDKETVRSIEHCFEGTRTVGKSWLAKLIIKLWEIYDQMWNYRNLVRHDKGKEKDKVTHEKANQEIRALVGKVPEHRFLMPAERRLFARTMDQLESKPLRVKRRWIRDATVILTKFYDEQETVKEVRLFRNYFSNKKARYSENIQSVDITKDGG